MIGLYKLNHIQIKYQFIFIKSNPYESN